MQSPGQCVWEKASPTGGPRAVGAEVASEVLSEYVIAIEEQGKALADESTRVLGDRS